jgi:uncharacterized protein YodC (DUF2158 family)
MADAKIVSLNPNPIKQPEIKGKFNPGDVVSLASGGFLMTVRKANKAAVICDWTNEVGDLCTAEFIPAMLKPGELEIEVELDDATEEA